MTDTPFRIGDDHDASHHPTFDPPQPGEVNDQSVLAALQDALSKPIETEPALINVLGRPGVQLRCHTRMRQEERKAWLARCTKKRRGADDEVDEMKFACLVIANTCEAVLFNGVEAHDSEGTPLTFRHAKLWEMVGAKEPDLAIRGLFGKDAHVLLASGEVLVASGFDDDVKADPTTAG